MAGLNQIIGLGIFRHGGANCLCSISGGNAGGHTLCSFNRYGKSRTLFVAIARGHGLLARGPEPVIAALEKRLQGMLRVNSLPSHVLPGQYTALTIDSQWVVCKAVAVTELGS